MRNIDLVLLGFVIVTCFIIYFYMKYRVLISSGMDFMIRVKRLVKEYHRFENMDIKDEIIRKRNLNKLNTSSEELLIIYDVLEKFEFDYSEDEWKQIRRGKESLDTIRHDIRCKKWEYEVQD